MTSGHLVLLMLILISLVFHIVTIVVVMSVGDTILKAIHKRLS